MLHSTQVSRGFQERPVLVGRRADHSDRRGSCSSGRPDIDRVRRASGRDPECRRPVPMRSTSAVAAQRRPKVARERNHATRNTRPPAARRRPPVARVSRRTAHGRGGQPVSGWVLLPRRQGVSPRLGPAAGRGSVGTGIAMSEAPAVAFRDVTVAVAAPVVDAVLGSPRGSSTRRALGRDSTSIERFDTWWRIVGTIVALASAVRRPLRGRRADRGATRSGDLAAHLEHAVDGEQRGEVFEAAGVGAVRIRRPSRGIASRATSSQCSIRRA